MLFGILAAVAVILLCKYVSDNYYQLMLIRGESMLPSYRPYQLVLLEKRVGDYHPGDVVAFRCEGLSAVLVKRIAAVPGDTAVIEEGTLYVNDAPAAFYEEGAFAEAGLLAERICLSDGEYLVIGDNVAESKDSRSEEVGVVKKADMIGRVVESGERRG